MPSNSVPNEPLDDAEQFSSNRFQDAKKWTDQWSNYFQQKENSEPVTKQQDKTAANSDFRSRLSLTQMTTKNWSLERELQACCELKLNNIGLWRTKYEEIGHDRTAMQLEDHRIKPSSISWVGGFTCANGYKLDDLLDDAREVVHYANWIGAPNVVVATGEQGQHILSHARRMTADAVCELADEADEKNVQLAIMPMPPDNAHGWTFLDSLRKTREFLSQCDHPTVGICLNSYLLLRNKHWKQELEKIIGSVKLVRLCDSKPKPNSKAQCLPMQGRLPIYEFIELLEAAGYRGLYEIDTWTDEVWQTDSLQPFQECVSALSL